MELPALHPGTPIVLRGKRLRGGAIAGRDRRGARQAARQMITDAARAISRMLEAGGVDGG